MKIAVRHREGFHRFVTFKEYCDNHSYTFHYVKPGCKDIENIRHIHPIKQLEVKSLVESLSKFKEVKGIVIFGSSTNLACEFRSDVDIAISLNEDSMEIRNKLLLAVSNSVNRFDLIWYDDLDDEEPLLSEIDIKGRKVYSCVN